MKFTTGVLTSALAFTGASAVAIPSWGEPNGAGPFAIKLVSGNEKYDGKYISLTDIKPQLTLATVNPGSDPVATFFTSDTGNLLASNGATPGTFEAAFSKKVLIGQHAKPLYFVALNDFAPKGPVSAVDGFELQTNFGLDTGRLARGKKTTGFYACSGTRAEGGDGVYDAIMVSEGDPFVPSCEEVELKVEIQN